MYQDRKSGFFLDSCCDYHHIRQTGIWFLFYDEEDYYDEEELEVDDIADEQDSEATIRRKQLEKMAKDKPDEFAKLLRTWISED